MRDMPQSEAPARRTREVYFEIAFFSFTVGHANSIISPRFFGGNGDRCRVDAGTQRKDDVATILACRLHALCEVRKQQTWAWVSIGGRFVLRKREISFKDKF